MSDRSVVVRLSADISQYVAALNQASAKTKQFADDTQKMAEKSQKSLAGGFIKQHEADLKTVSNGLLGFGAAALAATGLAVKGYADFDEQMSAVKATGADAAQNIDALRQAAMDAGREFGQFTGREAAEGIEELAKAGVSAADILGGALTGSLSLAAAGTIQVGEAAEYVAKTMAQFQLSGADAGRIADVLAASAGKAVGEVGDFGQALAQTGLVANQYGISMEETAGTLALFAQNSLVGSDAGTSMKAMLLQLAQPTKQAQKVLDQYNISAYDAQGNFVGMAGLAEQLSTKLGTLGLQQQNAALKTVFGNDAIRAASLLMREGGAAVRQWTKDVSEQGFAAQVAATKMDNLKGDIAGLGGAWENLMISMGEGGNGPLRSIVQDLSRFIDGLADTPPAAQRFALGALAVTGSAALISGGFIKAVTGAVELRSAWTTLATDAPRTAAAFKGAAVGLGTLAGAFIAATIAGSAYQESIDKGLLSNAEMIGTMMALGKGGALDAVNSDIQSMGTSAADVGEAFDFLNGKSGWVDRMGRDMGKAIPSLFGMKSATTQYADEIDKVDKALTGLDARSAANAFNRFVEQSGRDIADVAPHMDDYKKKLVEQANALGVTGLTAQDYVAWMGGKVPAAIANATAAAAASGKDITGLANATTNAAKAAELAAAAADEQREAYRNLANAALGLSGSQMGVEAAIDDATASIEKNGKTLNIGTEQGRANKSALDNIAAAALSLTEAQRKTGASGEFMDASMAKNRESFITTATSMGMTKEKANELADSYGLIPKSIFTQVELTGAGAVISKASEVQKAINGITGKTVYIRTVYTQDGAPQTATKGVNVARAAGGAVWGAGTSTSDSILAAVSTGEYVLRTAAAEKIGYHRLDYMNRTGELPRFATGGPVAPRWTPQPMPGYSPPPAPAASIRQEIAVRMVGGTATLHRDSTVTIRDVALEAISDVAADSTRRSAYLREQR